MKMELRLHEDMKADLRKCLSPRYQLELFVPGWWVIYPACSRVTAGTLILQDHT